MDITNVLAAGVATGTVLLFAAIRASHGLPVATAAEKPATAPMSIIPSTPRFRTPDRSAKISPMAANRMIVPLVTPAARMVVQSIRSSPSTGRTGSGSG